MCEMTKERTVSTISGIDGKIGAVESLANEAN